MTTQSATITVSIPHDYAVRLGVAQIRELTVGPEISQADRDELARLGHLVSPGCRWSRGAGSSRHRPDNRECTPAKGRSQALKRIADHELLQADYLVSHACAHAAALARLYSICAAA